MKQSTLGRVKQELIMLLSAGGIEEFAETIWGLLREEDISSNAAALTITQQVPQPKP